MKNRTKHIVVSGNGPNGESYIEWCLTCLKTRPYAPNYSGYDIYTSDEKIYDFYKMKGWGNGEFAVNDKNRLKDCDSNRFRDSHLCNFCECKPLEIIETTKEWVNKYLEVGYKIKSEHTVSNDKYAGELKQFANYISGNWRKLNIHIVENTVGSQYRLESKIVYIMVLNKNRRG